MIKLYSCLNGFPIPYWAVRSVKIKVSGVNLYEDAPGGYENTQSQFVGNLNSKSQQTFFNGPSITFYNSGGANTAKATRAIRNNFPYDIM